jgi:NAD(P)H-dependent FMN reductase
MSTIKPQILAFAGSLRRGSLNKKVLSVAVESARATGADVTLVDLSDFPMPVYDGDLDEREGLPENARKLKALMKSHQGFLIATPEYNSSIPGAFKNVLDWASRQEEGEAPLACFTGKIAVIMSASPGALGGLRSLVVLRAMLENIGTLVIPDQVAVSKAHEAFADDDTLKDAKRAASIQQMTSRFVHVVARLGDR